MIDATQVRIAINPEPDDEEKAAIAAAVIAMSRNVQEDEEKGPVSKWREAGKRESLRDQVWEKRS